MNSFTIIEKQNEVVVDEFLYILEEYNEVEMNRY